MSDAPIRVLLVDDEPLIRAGLRMILDGAGGIAVVGEAADGLDAAARVADLHPHVVLMDVRMPVLDGIEATARLLGPADRDGSGSMKVVMLTTYDLDEYLLAAIKAGASGFLLKNAPPPDLLAAIRTVHAGDAVIAPSATKRLLSHVITDTQPGNEYTDSLLKLLTEREREVLEQIAAGLSNVEIAARMFLSETTVKTHVRHLLAKLRVRDRVQAVVFAYESGLVRPG